MVRIKNRYLLVNILYPELEKRQEKTEIPEIVAFNQPTTDNLTSQALMKALKSEVSFLFGDYGAGAIADNLSSNVHVQFRRDRASRAHYSMVWSALSLMTAVPVKDGKKCVFRVIRVSGTMKKVEEELIRRAQEIIHKTKIHLVTRSSSSLLDERFGPDETAKIVCDDDEVSDNYG